MKNIFYICLVLIIIGTMCGDDSENENLETPTTETLNVRYTSHEAEQYMRKTCDNTNQTLMKKKTVYLDGTKIYMFMSVAENGMTCVSTVSEIKLELMSADCDETQIKINQWNAIKDGARL